MILQRTPPHPPSLRGGAWIFLGADFAGAQLAAKGQGCALRKMGGRVGGAAHGGCNSGNQRLGKRLLVAFEKPLGRCVPRISAVVWAVRAILQGTCCGAAAAGDFPRVARTATPCPEPNTASDGSRMDIRRFRFRTTATCCRISLLPLDQAYAGCGAAGGGGKPIVQSTALCPANNKILKKYGLNGSVHWTRGRGGGGSLSCLLSGHTPPPPEAVTSSMLLACVGPATCAGLAFHHLLVGERRRCFCLPRSG